jgi:DNA replication protein DnaC
MNLIELNRALGQLRLGGIAAVLETRIRQAQAEAMPPIDFLSCLLSDELTRRGERSVPLLIIDDLGMRKLPMTAAEDWLEIVMRRYERASTLLTSNRPVHDWGKLRGDSAVVTAMLDRLLHHGHVLKCGPRSWRTKTDLPPQEAVE